MGEQGQINRPEHTAGGSQNKGTEKLQRRACPSPLEVGGRGEGKGANSAPEEPPPPTGQTGSRFLSEDFLRPDQRGALGPQREKTRCARGEGAKPLAARAAQAGEDTKRRHNRICAFVEDPKTGTALNAEPTPYRAAGSLSSVDGESTDTPVRGRPSVAGTRRVLPTDSDVCLQRPALPAAGLN